MAGRVNRDRTQVISGMKSKGLTTDRNASWKPVRMQPRAASRRKRYVRWAPRSLSGTCSGARVDARRQPLRWTRRARGLDLKIEARQPVHTHRGPVRVGWIASSGRTSFKRFPLLEGSCGTCHVYEVSNVQPARLQHAADRRRQRWPSLSKTGWGDLARHHDLLDDATEIPADCHRMAVDGVQSLPASGRIDRVSP